MLVLKTEKTKISLKPLSWFLINDYDFKNPLNDY